MKGLLIFFVVAVLMTGCGNPDGGTEGTPSGEVAEKTEENEGKNAVENAGENAAEKSLVEEETGTVQNPENKTADSTKKEEPVSEPVSISVFVPDENAEGFVEKEVQIPEINQREIWNVLLSEGAVSEGSELLSLSREGRLLRLDVNRAFGDSLRSTGTTGETMMMGAVVNTFLKAYECDSVLMTEEGDLLESGHREYGEALSRFE